MQAGSRKRLEAFLDGRIHVGPAAGELRRAQHRARLDEKPTQFDPALLAIERAAIQALWQAVFERHLDGLPLLRVCVTRAQPDNAGLARWLCE